MDYRELKDRQRSVRDGFSTALGLRVHRALSWYGRAEREDDDPDARFLFLWIAFNAAYANELPTRGMISEQGMFANFVKRLVALDSDRLLADLVWTAYPGAIRILIDNKYIFQPFWDHHNGREEAFNWEQQFRNAKAAAHRALGRHDTAKLLQIVLGRLYTLRNQLVHGGATWSSSVNRDQVRDGAVILMDIVPAVIHIMMESADQVWGEPCYPVVD